MVLDPNLYAPLLRDAQIRSTELVKQITMQQMFGTPKHGMRTDYPPPPSSEFMAI